MIRPDPHREIADRKKRFDTLNRFVTERHGWITSIPGASDVTIECLPESALPGELRELGYDVREVGDGERFLPAAIVEHFTRRADGELEPLVVGSTRRVAATWTHAGVSQVKRYVFDLGGGGE